MKTTTCGWTKILPSLKRALYSSLTCERKKRDFLDFRVQNQLEFEDVSIIKLHPRSMPLGFHVSYGTMWPLTYISNTPGGLQIRGMRVINQRSNLLRGDPPQEIVLNCCKWPSLKRSFTELQISLLNYNVNRTQNSSSIKKIKLQNTISLRLLDEFSIPIVENDGNDPVFHFCYSNQTSKM